MDVLDALAGAAIPALLGLLIAVGISIAVQYFRQPRHVRIRQAYLAGAHAARANAFRVTPPGIRPEERAAWRNGFDDYRRFGDDVIDAGGGDHPTG